MALFNYPALLPPARVTRPSFRITINLPLATDDKALKQRQAWVAIISIHGVDLGLMMAAEASLIVSTRYPYCEGVKITPGRSIGMATPNLVPHLSRGHT